MVGSIINNTHGSGWDVNVSEVTQTGVTWQHPCDNTSYLDACLTYVTNRDIFPGEEILSSYGPTYRSIYFQGKQPNPKNRPKPTEKSLQKLSKWKARANRAALRHKNSSHWEPTVYTVIDDDERRAAEARIRAAAADKSAKQHQAQRAGAAPAAPAATYHLQQAAP